MTKPSMLKIIAALMCLAAGIGVLSGCSGNNQQTTSSESAEIVSENTADNSSSEHIQGVSSDESATSESKETNTAELPITQPLELVFSSGAGGWGTSMTLNSDGSFEGSYRDSEMGIVGDGYPNGTAYICEFSGKFDNIKQIDDTTYSFTLKKITTKNTEGEEWIENNIRYIAADPYGLENGTEFLFYLPQTPVNTLTEEFIQWGYGSVGVDSSQETLDCYGLYNKEMGYGFFSYNISSSQ